MKPARDPDATLSALLALKDAPYVDEELLPDDDAPYRRIGRAVFDLLDDVNPGWRGANTGTIWGNAVAAIRAMGTNQCDDEPTTFANIYPDGQVGTLIAESESERVGKAYGAREVAVPLYRKRGPSAGREG